MFLKAFLTNSSGILTSRIFGFIRDLMTANILGAGIYSDIFFVASKLPNLFRRVFGEGAFNQSFLPSFLQAKHKGGFALKILLTFSFILFVLSILVCIFQVEVTKILAFGFQQDKIELAAPLVAINFWYLLLVFIVTFFGAILQYKRNFTAWAYSPALLNICMIVALFMAEDKDSYDAVLLLSYGVLAGGIAQILLHIYPMYKLGFIKLLYAGIKEIKHKKDSINKSVSLFKKQFIPAMLGSSTAQIASFIDTLLASFLANGTISYLYYSNRIFQLPLAIFAIATSTALFPIVAKYIKNNQENLAISELSRSFWILLALLSACVLGGIMLNNEIIWLLFERGEFNREDTIITASIFSAYMIGLIPFGLARIFSLWLYSNHKQALAAKISVSSLAIGTICSIILMQYFGAIGLALAGSISGFALFFITIYFFGFSKFLTIINKPKWIVSIIFLLIALWCIIYIFKKYIFFLNV